MGLEPFNVASALNLVVAQRLVRRVCSRCRTKYEPNDEELAGAKVSRDMTFGDLRFAENALLLAVDRAVPEAQPFLKNVSLNTRFGDIPYFKGKGCEECSGTGLRGRQGLYEVLAMSPQIRKLILQNASGTELRDAAIANGMLTLRMDGWLKVLKGITSLEQVIRETSGQ
jgi:type II secretory ATPase GspE/PulE/Tfp pilus assembly ATPase PilB-like protein